MEKNLHEFEEYVTESLTALRENHIVDRIWSKDFTVWRDDPEEITNRLGWLDIAERYLSKVDDLQEFAREVYAEGCRHVLLLGMGGSSLAPEVLSKTFGQGDRGLSLSVLDSTDPGAIRDLTRQLDPAQTLFIVSTKSGGTVETLSFFKYFYRWTADSLGETDAGRHFVAITDPGSRLVQIAETYGFRKTFLNDPEIGGRYSALSLVGLVPAALLGMDVRELLERAVQEANAARSPMSEAASLGAILGILANHGRDKLSLILSGPIASFGDWVEQLIAESTGKEGKGILPVVGEPPGPVDVYGDDRVFVGLSLGQDTALDARLDALEAAGHPVVRFRLGDRLDLGGQFFRWEFATAVAGHVMDIQPFDQPNVESAKVLARKMVAQYHETGKLPEEEAAAPTAENLAAFLAGLVPGEYVAIQAFVRPSQEAAAAFHVLQSAIRSETTCAVTVGFGPRFLHSTGQLHKGDAGKGRFIQFVSMTEDDLPIPDEAGSWDSQMRFEVLKLSQALGDYQALRQADPPRQVIRFNTEEDPASLVRKLAAGLQK